MKRKIKFKWINKQQIIWGITLNLVFNDKFNFLISKMGKEMCICVIWCSNLLGKDFKTTFETKEMKLKGKMQIFRSDDGMKKILHFNSTNPLFELYLSGI